MSPEVVVAAESSVAVIVALAVGAAGEGLIVVAIPFIVVSMGVTVDPLPLASTVTQGFKADSVIANDILASENHVPGEQSPQTYHPDDVQGLQRQFHCL
jgi:hypothetical protein